MSNNALVYTDITSTSSVAYASSTSSEIYVTHISSAANTVYTSSSSASLDEYATTTPHTTLPIIYTTHISSGPYSTPVTTSVVYSTTTSLSSYVTPPIAHSTPAVYVTPTAVVSYETPAVEYGPCKFGAWKCFDFATLQQCAYGEKGLSWIITAVCPFGEGCVANHSFVGCAFLSKANPVATPTPAASIASVPAVTYHHCGVFGAWKCSDQRTLQQCAFSSAGLAWVTTAVCPFGQSCVSNASFVGCAYVANWTHVDAFTTPAYSSSTHSIEIFYTPVQTTTTSSAYTSTISIAYETSSIAKTTVASISTTYSNDSYPSVAPVSPSQCHFFGTWRCFGPYVLQQCGYVNSGLAWITTAVCPVGQNCATNSAFVGCAVA